MGLRVLITHPFLYEINGATCVTLELAEYLQSCGDTVTIYTNTLHNPIKKYLSDKKIHVDTGRDNPNYHLKDFDIVWINSQSFPISLLKELGDAEKIKHAPKFIFMHMSAHEECADELPYIYHFEEELSSLSLFVSEEAFNLNKKYFEHLPSYDFYRNPAPEAFSKVDVHAKDLKKLLVVANFPCDEVREIQPLLQEKGIAVDYLGYFGDKYDLISTDMISKYDAIISIGKTVQYCLVSGKPVYVYGQFGGPGWLDDANFEKAKKLNFSGRGFHDKTPEEITDEIILGYHSAANYYANNQKIFQEQFLIKNVLPGLLQKAKSNPKDIKPFSKAKIASMTSLLKLVMIDFERWYDSYESSSIINKLRQENRKLRNNNQQLQAVVSSKSVQLWLKLNRAIKRH